MKYIIEYTINGMLQGKSVFFRKSDFTKELKRLQSNGKYSNITWKMED